MKIPLFKITQDKRDIEEIAKVIKSKKNWAVGRNIDIFENLILNYVKTKYAVAFNSGTSALHAILLAYGIRKGDEVIVPSFTFIATVNSVLFVGAKPIFADIEEETYGLDPKDVERKITKKTKAIIAVHYGGVPCKIRELDKISKKHNIILIEDACESLGANIEGKMTGSFGNAGIFSFCQNKIITTGEGGMITTNDKALCQKLRLLRNYGKKENDFVSLGYNWKLANLLAALGISQFKKIRSNISERRNKVKYLNQRLFGKQPVVPKGYFFVYQLYTVNFGKDRDRIQEYFRKKGIETKIYFEPIHLTKFYREVFGYKKGLLPITEKISKEVLTLPMYPDLTRKEMDYIVKEYGNFKANTSGNKRIRNAVYKNS